MAKKPVDVNELLSSLPTLSEEDRKKVRQRLQVLSSGDDPEGVSGGASEDDLFVLFYGVLNNQLKEIGLSILPPANRLRQTHPKLYGSTMEGWRRIVHFMDSCFGKLGKRDYVRLFNLFSEMLLWKFNEQELEVTPTVVLTGIQRIPALVESQFPGYAKARCLFLLLKMGKPTTARDEEW